MTVALEDLNRRPLALNVEIMQLRAIEPRAQAELSTPPD